MYRYDFISLKYVLKFESSSFKLPIIVKHRFFKTLYFIKIRLLILYSFTISLVLLNFRFEINDLVVEIMTFNIYQVEIECSKYDTFK